MARAYGKKDVL